LKSTFFFFIPQKEKMEELNIKIGKRGFIPYALDWKTPLFPG